MANTVQVQNIAPSTEDKEIKDFFSFWFVPHPHPHPPPLPSPPLPSHPAPKLTPPP